MGAENPGPFMNLFPFILIFFIFYFLVFKPQQDKQKKQEEMIKNLKKNDEVITVGGAHGTVVNLKEKTVIVRVDEGTRIEFDREAIASLKK